MQVDTEGNPQNGKKHRKKRASLKARCCHGNRVLEQSYCCKIFQIISRMFGENFNLIPRKIMVLESFLCISVVLGKNCREPL